MLPNVLEQGCQNPVHEGSNPNWVSTLWSGLGGWEPTPLFKSLFIWHFKMLSTFHTAEKPHLCQSDVNKA